MKLYIQQAQWVGHKGTHSVFWLLFKKLSKCYIFINHHILFLREDEKASICATFTPLTVPGHF